jgi:hypothetical protein
MPALKFSDMCVDLKLVPRDGQIKRELYVEFSRRKSESVLYISIQGMSPK